MALARKFTILTILVSWSFIGLYTLLDGRWNTPLATGIGVIYMFIPAAVALLLERRREGGSLKLLAGAPLRPNRWYAVAWLLPFGLALATLAISLVFPGVRFDLEMSGLFERFAGVMSPEEIEEMRQQIDAMPVHPFLLGIGQALIAAVSINAVAAWGEEVGWRGFLLRELTPLGFWRSALIIGFIWGIWHAPIILLGHNYPQHPRLGVIMMIAFCVLTSPVIQYVRLRAGSVFAAAIFHGGINASAGLALMLVSGGSDLLIGVTGLAGFIALAAANIWVLVATRRGAPINPHSATT